MYVKIQTSGKGGNKGSCSDYANYLEKENEGKKEQDKEYFFSANKDKVDKQEVIHEIDRNTKKLGKADAKFYSVTISPSEKELKHIGNDREKLKEYTRGVMDEYAKNFKRDKVRSGNDLVYFAKVEDERKYKGTDKEVRIGEAKQGELKKGEQTHIHVIVSRKDKTNSVKLSPLANERGGNNSKLNGQKVQRGFDRSKFKTSCEEKFDKQFDYQREEKETFKYANEQKKKPVKEKINNLEQEVKGEKTREQQLEEARAKQIDRLRENQNEQGKGLDLN